MQTGADYETKQMLKLFRDGFQRMKEPFTEEVEQDVKVRFEKWRSENPNDTLSDTKLAKLIAHVAMIWKNKRYNRELARPSTKKRIILASN